MKIYVDLNKRHITRIDKEYDMFKGNVEADTLEVLVPYEQARLTNTAMCIDCLRADNRAIGSIRHTSMYCYSENMTVINADNPGTPSWIAYAFVLSAESGVLAVEGALQVTAWAIETWTETINSESVTRSKKYAVCNFNINVLKATKVNSHLFIVGDDEDIDTIAYDLRTAMNNLSTQLGQVNTLALSNQTSASTLQSAVNTINSILASNDQSLDTLQELVNAIKSMQETLAESDTNFDTFAEIVASLKTCINKIGALENWKTDVDLKDDEQDTRLGTLEAECTSDVNTSLKSRISSLEAVVPTHVTVSQVEGLILGNNAQTNYFTKARGEAVENAVTLLDTRVLNLENAVKGNLLYKTYPYTCSKIHSVESNVLRTAYLNKLSGKCEVVDNELIISAPQYIKNLKSNLFDKSKAVFGAIDLTNGVNDANNERKRSDYIAINPNTTYYYFSQCVIRIAYYDNNKSFVGSFGNNNYSQSFTTPSNACYLRFYVDLANVDTTMIKTINDSTYTEYAETTLSLENVGTLLEDYGGLECLAYGVNNDYNVLEFANCKAIIKYAKLRVGDITFTRRDDGLLYSNSQLSNAKDYAQLICSKYERGNDSYAGASTQNGYITISNGYIYIKDTAYSNASDFTTAMSGVYLIYELATPIEIPLTFLQEYDEMHIFSNGSIMALDENGNVIEFGLSYDYTKKLN